MVPFGGWEMPLSYPGGTLGEHRACRGGAVVFDVSHLGTVRVTGPGARDALQRSLTNDLNKVKPGRAQYTHLLSDDGSVLDDIIIWWVAPETFDVMPNASNTDEVVKALRSGAGADLAVQDTTSARAVLAIQGPLAREKMKDVSPEAASVARFGVKEFTFDQYRCVAAGTGYTGEDGIECAVPAAAAGAFWQAVLNAGVTPAGLGARDTLRLEAGLPLHGQDIGEGLTPLNAGLGWVVAWEKGDFPGRSALVAQSEAGVTPLLHGLRTGGRRPIRSGTEVMLDSRKIGYVSSGNFSPTLECGIALAYLSNRIPVGDTVSLSVRGTEVEAEVVDLPFVTKS